MMKYYVYGEKTSMWATPKDRQYADQLQTYRWDETPLRPDLPRFDCLIPQQKDMPDIVTVNGGAIHLYSRRLLNILSSHQVKFDTVPTQLFAPPFVNQLDLDYEMFHLLDYMDGLDEEQSVIDPDFYYVEKLVLTEACKKSGSPMMRMRNKFTLTLINEPLFESLKAANITKFRSLPVESYSYEKWLIS